MPWPRRWAKYLYPGPYPASVTTLRAAASTDSQVAPGLAACERRVLGLLDDVPDAALLVRWLAENDRPGDVGAVALDGAAAVDEDGVARGERARDLRAVRESGVRAELRPAAAGRPQLLGRPRDGHGQVARRHARAERFETLPEGELGDAVGQVHEGDLLGRLRAAASLRHRRAVDDLGRGERSAQAEDFEGPEVRGRSQLAGRGADVLEDAADRRVGILVLLPGPDLLAGRDELFGALGLEGRADPDRVLLAAEDDAEDALAQPPADLGEVEEIRAAADEQGVEAVFSQEPPGLLAAQGVILGPERLDLLHEVFEILRCAGRGGGRGDRPEPQGGQRDRTGLDE